MGKKGSSTKPLYSDELVGEICTKIAQGFSLKKVCALERIELPDGSMTKVPDYTTIMSWLANVNPKYDYFKRLYAQARCDQCENDLERIDEIVEKVMAGKVDPKAARVAIDAIKWEMGRKNPKKYADNPNLFVGIGGGGNQTVVINSGERDYLKQLIESGGQIPALPNSKTDEERSQTDT